MMQALRGEPLTVYGDGSQTRSFCYVSDLIDGILKLAKSDEHAPTNIGNPVGWTILQCAREVQALIGSNAEILFKPLPQDDPKQRQPDITKARTLLGWEPKVPLRKVLAIPSPTSKPASRPNRYPHKSVRIGVKLTRTAGRKLRCFTKALGYSTVSFDKQQTTAAEQGHLCKTLRLLVSEIHHAPEMAMLGGKLIEFCRSLT